MQSKLQNNDKDIKIAILKTQAFETTQKLRDYELLNEQYLQLQSKFQQLKNSQ